MQYCRLEISTDALNTQGMFIEVFGRVFERFYMLGFRTTSARKVIIPPEETENLYDVNWANVYLLVKAEQGTDTDPVNSSAMSGAPLVSYGGGTSFPISLSTAQKRYGTKSLYIPANADQYWTTTTNLSGGLTANCTIDFWIYYTGTDFSETMGLMGSASSVGLFFSIHGGNLVLSRGSLVTTATICTVAQAGLAPNRWHHIELNRESTTYKLFVDGVFKASASFTSTPGTQNFVIGSTNWTDGNRHFIGYIDNFRITLNVARHVDTGVSFTPGDAPTNSGGVMLTTVGTNTWTVPEGVTKICVALVGGGGNGIQRTAFGGSWSGGGGGGLAYKNNITVTPGQVISYTVAPSTPSGSSPINTAILGITAGSGAAGYDGTSGSFGGGGTNGDANYIGASVNSQTGGVSNGGNSATLTGNGTINGGTGTSLGIASGTTYGAGGQSVHSPSTPTNGQQGAIRILWGKNRSFPSGT